MSQEYIAAIISDRTGAALSAISEGTGAALSESKEAHQALIALSEYAQAKMSSCAPVPSVRTWACLNVAVGTFHIAVLAYLIGNPQWMKTRWSRAAFLCTLVVWYSSGATPVLIATAALLAPLVHVWPTAYTGAVLIICLYLYAYLPYGLLCFL